MITHRYHKTIKQMIFENNIARLKTTNLTHHTKARSLQCQNTCFHFQRTCFTMKLSLQNCGQGRNKGQVTWVGGLNWLKQQFHDLVFHASTKHICVNIALLCTALSNYITLHYSTSQHLTLHYTHTWVLTNIAYISHSTNITYTLRKLQTQHIWYNLHYTTSKSDSHSITSHQVILFARGNNSSWALG